MRPSDDRACRRLRLRGLRSALRGAVRRMSGRVGKGPGSGRVGSTAAGQGDEQRIPTGGRDKAVLERWDHRGAGVAAAAGGAAEHARDERHQASRHAGGSRGVVERQPGPHRRLSPAAALSRDALCGRVFVRTGQGVGASHPAGTIGPMPPLELISPFTAAGDQPEAIEALVAGVEQGDRYQTLLGITGSGKSFTIAGAIERAQRPTLVLAPNKSLAAQLASEFREFFPKNRVEYFVSYYDYYQPEAYVPSTDTYIEKDSSINDEIDRLRHSATSALMSRRDVIIVASVSAIYGLGAPEMYEQQCLILDIGEERDQRAILRRLVELQYERNDEGFVRNKFRVRGDSIEAFPAYEERGVRIQLFGDEIERMCSVDPVTGEIVEELDRFVLFPASHYVTDEVHMQRAIEGIEAELKDRLAWFEQKGKLLEAQRLRMRTTYYLEMLREIGTCAGIENYSRFLDGRDAGQMPYTLLDYFPDDFLCILDESHVTVPQLHGQ